MSNNHPRPTYCPTDGLAAREDPSQTAQRNETSAASEGVRP